MLVGHLLLSFANILWGLLYYKESFVQKKLKVLKDEDFEIELQELKSPPIFIPLVTNFQ